MEEDILTSLNFPHYHVADHKAISSHLNRSQIVPGLMRAQCYFSSIVSFCLSACDRFGFMEMLGDVDNLGLLERS